MIKLTPWKTLSSKVLHQTPWLRVLVDICQIPNGKEITYSYVNRVDGVSVIPITSENKILLVQQYRHPIKKIIWQFPAEGIEAGESWRECAERCLLEETNYQAETLTDWGLFHADPGTIDQNIHWFLATNVKPLSTPESDHTDETEEFNIKAFSMHETKQLIAEGSICDNWTLAGLGLLDFHQVIPQQ